VAACGEQEMIRLEADEPAPRMGRLLSDAEVEFLLKRAYDP